GVFTPPDPTTREAPQRYRPPDVRVLASGTVQAWPTGPVDVGLGRAVLAPGGRIDPAAGGAGLAAGATGAPARRGRGGPRVAAGSRRSRRGPGWCNRPERAARSATPGADSWRSSC